MFQIGAISTLLFPLVTGSLSQSNPTTPSTTCRFAPQYTCSDFKNPDKVEEYLNHVATWEGKFARPGIGYDEKSGYTYDGHPINYETGELYGEPHLFSAPSKESIHVGILALAVEGNQHALTFVGGMEEAIKTLQVKIDGYSKFNATYPGYGCFTPWVGFDAEKGIFLPIDNWSNPYKVPGLDNGEWFWSIYAATIALEKVGQTELASQYRAFMECQKKNVKPIFYRGNGDVSAVVTILDPFIQPTESNYVHSDGYLNDPYEGETITQMLYLFSPWESNEERETLWTKKRDLFQSSTFTIASPHEFEKQQVTVQKGWWFSAHEQWKALLMPYYDVPIVKKVYHNAEIARTWDAVLSQSPGLLASVNDVTNGSQDIPDYISPTGIQSIAFEPVLRRDVITPYGSYGLLLTDLPAGLCWYNNMLRGPRMQSAYGSTEAINVNGTEICPLTTWDSKITSVLAMLGGVGSLVREGLKAEKDDTGEFYTAYDRFLYVTNREYEGLFGNDEDFLLGEDIPIALPKDPVPTDKLSDWKLNC